MGSLKKVGELLGYSMGAPEVGAAVEGFDMAKRPGPDAPKSAAQLAKERTAAELEKRNRERASLYGGSNRRLFGSSENPSEANIRTKRLLGK